jgi:hypothetical protein
VDYQTASTLYLQYADNETVKGFIRQGKRFLVEKKVMEWFVKFEGKKPKIASPPTPEGGVKTITSKTPPSGVGGLAVQLIYEKRQAAFRLRDFWFYQLEKLSHDREKCAAACQEILKQKAIIRHCWALLSYYDKFKKLPEVEPEITLFLDEAQKQQRIRTLTANISRDRKDGKLQFVEKWEKELYLLR